MGLQRIDLDLIDAGASNRAGWTMRQILLLGVGRETGWKRRALGKMITPADAQRFVELAGSASKARTLLPAESLERYRQWSEGRHQREVEALKRSETLTPFRKWLASHGGIDHSWDDVTVETDPWAP